jgi:hypothetical protein
VIRNIISLVYVIVGVAVANSHKYFDHVNTFMAGLSAVLGVLLWPLVLAGVHFHLR